MIRTGQAKGLVEDVIVPTEKIVELIKGATLGPFDDFRSKKGNVRGY